MDEVNVSGLPKEALENEAVKRLISQLNGKFMDIFDDIGDVVNSLPIAPGMEKIMRPILRIQYANLIQLAFNEAYKSYIGKASLEFSKDGMSALFNGGKE